MAIPTMPHRANLSRTSWIALILRKKLCWHVDAWLYEDERGALWLRILTSAGGTVTVGEAWLRVSQWPTGEWDYHAVDVIGEQPDVTRCTERYLHSRWSREGDGRREEQLNRMHWQRWRALLTEIPKGYAYSSVVLHYVRAVSIDPLEGAANWHRYSYTPPRPLAALAGLL